MNFLSAITKGFLRQLNNKLTESDTKKAKRIAFSKTGNKLRVAKKQNRKVNGSRIYKSELKKQLDPIQKRHDFFDDFIGDL